MAGYDVNWPHFTEWELACKCGCGRSEMDQNFMWRLEQVRTAYDRPMRVSSAFRCPDHNARVSSTGRDGPHTTGKAIDILVLGSSARELLALILEFEFTGIGLNQKGAYERRFIHMDLLARSARFPRPWIWTY